MKEIKQIYVIDIETSGLDGYPIDLIFEIGMCLLKVEDGKITKVYDEVIGYKENQLADKHKKAWIFDNSTLSMKQVLGGKKLNIVAKEVRKILKNKYIAFYNVDYDYEKFLKFKPFLLINGENCEILPCIMKASTSICKIDNPYFQSYKWPKLKEAEKILLNKKELKTLKEKNPSHRAISDAYLSAKLLYKLIIKHNFLDQVKNEK